jgi:ribokinase
LLQLPLFYPITEAGFVVGGTHMVNRPRIVVLGSLVFDFVARAPRLPREGETLLGDLFGMFPGGKGANQAVQAARLGAEVFMIGRVGRDLLGERLLASLQESGVDTQCVKQDPAVKTASCCIHVDAQGHNAIIMVPEANLACREEDVKAAAGLIESADLLLAQLEIPLSTVTAAVGLAAQNSVKVILNPAPAQALPKALLAQVTLLTPNESEAETLSGHRIGRETHPETGYHPSVAEAARKILHDGSQAVIITLAERGAFYATPEKFRLFPAYSVHAVDTTAAGDAFNGAAAVALAEGRSMEDAIRFANAAGAIAATRPGAQPSLPARAEVETFIQQASLRN